jgi:hypothetical protein
MVMMRMRNKRVNSRWDEAGYYIHFFFSLRFCKEIIEFFNYIYYTWKEEKKYVKSWPSVFVMCSKLIPDHHRLKPKGTHTPLLAAAFFFFPFRPTDPDGRPTGAVTPCRSSACHLRRLRVTGVQKNFLYSRECNILVLDGKFSGE